MLVIAIEPGPADGGMRWAGRRHDDDRPDATSGTSSGELFDAVFHALHDGEQVALGIGGPLAVPLPQDRSAPGGRERDQELLELAEPASSEPGIAQLGQLLSELGTWRPWTTVSTSLPRWTANTSILVWEAVPAAGSGGVAAGPAVESFFRKLRAAAGHQREPAAGPAADRRAAHGVRPVKAISRSSSEASGPGATSAAKPRPRLSSVISSRARCST
jgi:hypothetical protein